MKGNTRFLNALNTGDSAIINELYSNVFPVVRKFILKNNGQEVDAEDIFQKAIIQISVRYRKEQFEITTSFEAFLFTACKNLWRRELNKSKKRVTNIEVIEQLSEEEDQAIAILEQSRWEIFSDNLKKLSENCNKVLALFFAKTPYSTIVTRLNYNSETVARQRVFKCKAKLTQMIKNDPRFKNLLEL